MELNGESYRLKRDGHLDAPTLAEMRIDRKQAALAGKLGEMDEKECNALMDELIAEGKTCWCLMPVRDSASSTK